MGKSPEGPFAYKGVLVSNADLGRAENTQPRNYLGNNHGSIAKIGEKYYIFYHRHTHGGQFSRQACADELTMNPDGTFSQAEITSCGLNGGPLPAKHSYPATIACCLMGPDRETMGMLPLKPENGPKNPIPYHTGAKNEFAEGGYRSRIENLRPGAVFGFKYLDFGDSASHLAMTLRGTGAVSLRLDDPDSGEVAALSVDSGAWAAVSADFKPITGVHAVYFSVIGSADDKIACTDFQFR